MIAVPPTARSKYDSGVITAEYFRTIAHCLKPGTGVWINTGPLLWHQAAGAPYDCLQLSQEELLQVRDFVTVSLRLGARLGTLDSVPAMCCDRRVR